MSKRSRDEEGGGLVFSTNRTLLDSLGSLMPEDTPQPQDQKLYVRRDAKARRGKVVTLVEGFVGAERDLKELGKSLKAACGVGGAVKDGVILIQGDSVDRVMEYLLSNGYTKTRKKGG